MARPQGPKHCMALLGPPGPQALHGSTYFVLPYPPDICHVGTVNGHFSRSWRYSSDQDSWN